MGKQGYEKFLRFILLISCALMLASCSSSKEKAEVSLEEEESEIIVEKAPSAEVEARKPIYVYENKPEKIFLKKVTLRLNSEPLLLPSGYVRLVGVVSGGRPMALIEVGGRGLCVGIGEAVGAYRVVQILKKGIKLVRKEG